MKIAIITNRIHSKIGGIENNNRMLYQLFSKVHSFTEYPLSFGEDVKSVAPLNKNVVVSSMLAYKMDGKKITNKFFTKEKMSKIYRENDLVIYRLSAPAKKWLSNSKSVVVQHFDRKYYTFLGKSIGSWYYPLGFALDSIFFGNGTIGNPFKYASNSVFYDRKTALFTKGNKFYVPLGKIKEKDVKTSSKGDYFSWVARLENQKNPKEIVKIANINKDVLIWGSGTKEGVLKKLSCPKQYRGVAKNDKVLDIFSNAKAMLMTSKSEGFGWTVVEALSVGTPVILYKTFDAADFFDECDAVFLVEKGNTQQFLEAMKYIDSLSEKEYENLSKNANKFVKENLTSERFKEKWAIVFDSFK